ncbi:MG296/MPN423 family protein [Mycoplasma bradburyae]|uniref:MG296/MPN423 family protein n=1 Tax=Mycoplasma bradburyae TaxID=2963128 RepID=A0ABT5G9K6_9MOLU|nr:MG296/MPN423 family protein [Mycoplasma bradburyae]MDC4162976.1 MG296/MPN423 family protein [Mycoplasma bradburyae]MDC4181587.1 MG296/MPN423 family protein [Mycoplasma bradburyae]MDC4182313.1 MG296/MPN423 family protein [Mycoplasma bradburyae]MDC4183758.1 MG296/MPN423 family protein [Mycoplasma bradburyae]UTS69990.1 MG296/MPN423 family protein [Mycoplasma bradburyae]
MQNLKTYIEKLKDLLSNIDLEKLINNYNKIMDKSMHTRIMYDDDEYAEIDFFEKQIEGEIEFIKTKLIQEVDEYIQDILKTKFSDEKKLALLHDHFYNLTQAIALTKNISFKRLNKLLNEEY